MRTIALRSRAIMGSKLALIVDDSRSARAVLARMLERHAIDVDMAESAGEAIHYLSTRRPDVIFMDHLMPGMDGLQAVQAIKNDPRTATIPIMMYTSQEGDVYVGQARALGAVGVLPKQTRIADVSRALEQLHLIEEGAQPIDTRAASAETRVGGGSPAAQLAALPPDLRKLIESLLAEHAIDLRRFVVEHLDHNAERIVGDLKLLIRDGSGPATTGAHPADATDAVAIGGESSPRVLRWVATAAAVLAALVIGLLWPRGEAERGEPVVPRATLGSIVTRSAVEKSGPAAPAAPERKPEVGAGASGPITPVLVDLVPFGEVPYAGARVEHVQALLERLMSEGFRGTVQIRSFPGRYCLAGSGENAMPAADDTPIAKCEQFGNLPDGGTSAARQSIAFANMLAGARRTSGGSIDVQLMGGSVDETAQSYPAPSDTLSARQWNRVAAANNRIEARLVPATVVAPATGAASPGP
jgi:CheY-like chemotaxis protein